MKYLSYCSLLISMLTLSAFRLNAQHAASRHHEGLYVSFGMGSCFGHIDEKDSYPGIPGDYKSKVTGSAMAIDFRIGGAVKKDWVVTFDMVGRTMMEPVQKTDTVNMNWGDQEYMDESTIGLGVTRFFMPYNINVGATFGLGRFIYPKLIGSPENNELARSRDGFSWLLRAGKSWYVSKKWGVGIGLAYGNTSTHTVDAGRKQDFSSSRLIGTVLVSYQ